MSLSFDSTFYQTQRPDVYNAFIATAGSTGLTWAQFAEQHYDTFGRFEGSDPHASFDTSFYLTQYPDVAAAGVNPFDHFLANGSLEDRQPYSTFPNAANGFDATAYKAANADLASLSDAAAYQHFVVHGQFEIASGARTSTGAPTVTPPTGTPGETFTLTTGPDAFTGSELDDTFVASEATLGSADVLDGAGGNDLLRYASSGAAAVNEAGFSASNIETVQVTSDAVGGTTFDMTGVTGATTLNNTNSSQNLTVTGLSGILALGSTNVSGGNTTVQYKDSVLAGTADAQTLNLTGNSNNAGAGVSTINIGNSTSGGTAGLETLNIATSGSASSLVDIVTGAATINISGDQALTVANILDGATVINAGTSTGAISVVADSAVNDVVVTGGSANDTANFSASFDAGDSFDGGDGTDTLGLTNAVATGTPGGSATNVEILNVTTAGTGTIDMDNFTGIGTVNYDAGLGGATIVDDAVTGLTVGVDVTAGGNNLTVDLKTDGTADELTVAIDEVGAADALGTVNIDDAETANVSVDDDTTVAGTGTVTVANLSINDATALNLSGNANLTIGAFTGPATDVLATVDASGLTGNLTVTGLGALLHNTAATVTLGSGNDTVNGGTGLGADTITTGTGTDVIFYNNINQSSGTKVDTVTDFTTGTDDIDLTGLGIVASNQFVGNFGSFGAAQGAVSAGGAIEAVFQTDTSTLWVDVNNDGALNANDLQVILTGVTSLAATDLNIAGVGNTIDLTAAAAVVNTTTNTNATNKSTNENDTITASTTDLVGSTINAALGTDTMTVSGTAAAGESAGLTVANTTALETVNADSTVEDVTITGNVLASNGGAVTTLSGAAGTNQSLTVGTGVNFLTTAISNLEFLNLTGAGTMTTAQHNAFAVVNGLGGADTITLSGAGDVNGSATVENYVLSATANTFTVNAAQAGVNLTESAANDQTVNIGGNAITGNYVNFDGGAGGDILVATTGANITGAQGNGGGAGTALGFGVLNLTGNLSATAAQHNGFTTINGTGTNTVTLSGAGNVTGNATIETYNLGDTGRTIFLGANLAQNVNEDVNGQTHTLDFTTGVFTGNVTGLDAADDVIQVSNGTNIAGVNSGATLIANNLTFDANAAVTLTQAQYDVFNGGTITAGGATDSVTITTTTTTSTNDAAIEGYTLSSTGNDVFEFDLANAGTTAFTANIAAGGNDRLILDNATIEAAATEVVTVSGFTAGAGADTFSSHVGGASIVTGAYTSADGGSKITGQAAGNVIEIHSTGVNGVSIAAPTNDASVLAALNGVLTNGGTVGDIANGNYTVIGYNGTNGYVYQVTVAGGDGTAGGDEVVELIGTFNGIGADAFTAANIV